VPAVPAGTPCWADIRVTDTDRATAFSSAVLGWPVSEGQADVGGFATARAHGAARTHGGTTIGDPFGSPFGCMAPLIDPFGTPLWFAKLGN